MAMRIRVQPTGGAYEIVVGEALLERVGESVSETCGVSRVVLVTDESVAGLYAGAVEESLTAEGFGVELMVVPAGESSKRWSVAGDLLERMARSGLGRKDIVVALGGGVVGDLAGFCAATYMRGIRYVQIPTTLLAQVDSSVGGKTAVDLDAGKNLAGAFWQPSLVIADTSTLTTLDDGQWSSGLAEMVKGAFLSGESDTFFVEDQAEGLIEREQSVVVDSVARSVRFKASVVSRDEREAGLRECLNLGHTLGHAIELLAGWGKIVHGHAVAEGVRFAAALAVKLGHADLAWAERQCAVLDALGIPRVAFPADAHSIVAAMHADKKARHGDIRVVLSVGAGEWVVVEVGDHQLVEALEAFIGEGEKS